MRAILRIKPEAHKKAVFMEYLASEKHTAITPLIDGNMALRTSVG